MRRTRRSDIIKSLSSLFKMAPKKTKLQISKKSLQAVMKLRKDKISRTHRAHRPKAALQTSHFLQNRYSQLTERLSARDISLEKSRLRAARSTNISTERGSVKSVSTYLKNMRVGKRKSVLQSRPLTQRCDKQKKAAKRHPKIALGGIRARKKLNTSRNRQKSEKV